MSKRLKEDLRQTEELGPHAPLSRKEAATYLREKYLTGSQSFLAKAAMRGDGPPFEMFCDKAIYRPTFLDQWAEARLGGPRTEAAHRAKASELSGEGA
jgi:hypothetical protein